MFKKLANALSDKISGSSLEKLCRFNWALGDPGYGANWGPSGRVIFARFLRSQQSANSGKLVIGNGLLLPDQYVIDVFFGEYSVILEHFATPRYFVLNFSFKEAAILDPSGLHSTVVIDRSVTCEYKPDYVIGLDESIKLEFKRSDDFSNAAFEHLFFGDAGLHVGSADSVVAQFQQLPSPFWDLKLTLLLAAHDTLPYDLHKKLPSEIGWIS